MRRLSVSSKRTAKEITFQVLKERIMRQEFRTGESLPEATIAKLLGVSRTPVREAILQLQREGLVEVIPNRGAFVTFITLKDLKNIVQMLQILETASMEMAVEQIDTAKLDALEAELLAVKELGPGVSYDETSMPGIKLHDMILTASGNERIFKTCNQLREQMRALTRLAVGAPGRLLESNDEHLKILRALKAKNVAAAQRAAMEHLANMYRVVTQVVV